MEKYSVIIVAILSLIGNVLSGLFAGNKTRAIMDMRLQALEGKVDKHNKVIERTYELEKCKDVIEVRLKMIEEDVDNLSRKVENNE